MYGRFTSAKLRVVVGFALVAVVGTAVAEAQYGNGSIVGWGTQVVGVDLSAGFAAIAGGGNHSLGLRGEGSIVGWGWNWSDQCNAPQPNADFVAVAAGEDHSLGLKADGSIVAWGWNDDGQCDVPA
ncbi:MAG TPA: RCC1 domain-containing protein, partial [Phycisphaerae bacterium]|nr:RCC1 domain-containing protein [Phycisphaerae bacterium]